MDIGTVYPNMKEFRLTMRLFAINEELKLHIMKYEPQWYIGIAMQKVARGILLEGGNLMGQPLR